MHFIIKLFPEIIVKSPPVRRRQTALLRDNLHRLLDSVNVPYRVIKDWEKIELTVNSDLEKIEHQIVDVLTHTPGIAKFSRALVQPFDSLEDIPQLLPNTVYEHLHDCTFAVRVKRSGNQTFNSVDVERLVGAWVLKNQPQAQVNLKNPQVTIELEVRGDRLFVLERTWPGLGGYPLGSQGAVLSMLSGGFDSSVASYQMLRRGLLTHFVFFNLGGAAHETGVREIAYHLWSKFAASHSLKFISVPFEQVVEAIRQKAPSNYGNIILKRLMLSAANEIAGQANLPALVTGDSVAQVSSQTLTNLAITDAASALPVLRPLISSDKGAIIDMAREIGTADIASSIPEYCGLVAEKPTTEAKADKVEQIEETIGKTVLKDCLNKAVMTSVNELLNSPQDVQIDSYAKLPQGASVIDIRHPSEIEQNPLQSANQVVEMPFYKIQSGFQSLDSERLYLLYCDRGLLSRLHAELLIESGQRNVGVYRPSI